MTKLNLAGALGALSKFEESKHKRGQGGKFTGLGGGGKPAAKQSGSVATAHGIFDKMKGKPKAEVLAAAQAAGINPNTAKTQLYHWQKKQAAAALGNNPAPTKAELQAAAAKALGVKPVAAAAKPAPKAIPDHLKGYDDIVNSNHSAGDKMTLVTSKYKDDLESVHEAADFDTVKANYVAAKDKIKAQLGIKSAATPTPAPKPPTAPVAAPKAAQQVETAAPDLAKLGPTKYVHALADHMKGAEKKAVIAAATAAGVNKSTAGVQYGKWAAKQAGEKPQLEKSPEPKALQAKQPEKMSNKELDEAIDSYQGKVDYKAPAADLAPKPYKHPEDYTDNQGGKALTGKLGTKEVYTNQQQGKTFYKDAEGNVHEHVGASGAMIKVAGDKPSLTYHYDPATKVVYAKVGGVLKPVQGVKTPLFKNQQPYEPGNHVFKDHAWAGANGIQDPKFEYSPKGLSDLGSVHKAAGTTYSESEAVSDYTGTGYENINDGLRGETELYPHSKKYIDQLDKEMSQSSFKKETIMWRGVGQGGTVFNGAPPPSEITDNGFSSVSFRPDVAKRFSDNKTLFRVKVPAGFPGLNVAIGQPGSGAEGLRGEAEVILPRGTTYRVIARHAAKGPTSSKYDYFKNKTVSQKMDVVDLEPVLPDWYIKKYGQPKVGG